MQALWFTLMRPWMHSFSIAIVIIQDFFMAWNLNNKILANTMFLVLILLISSTYKTELGKLKKTNQTEPLKLKWVLER